MATAINKFKYTTYLRILKVTRGQNMAKIGTGIKSPPFTLVKIPENRKVLFCCCFFRILKQEDLRILSYNHETFSSGTSVATTGIDKVVKQTQFHVKM